MTYPLPGVEDRSGDYCAPGTQTRSRCFELERLKCGIFHAVCVLYVFIVLSAASPHSIGVSEAESQRLIDIMLRKDTKHSLRLFIVSEVMTRKCSSLFSILVFCKDVYLQFT